MSACAGKRGTGSLWLSPACNCWSLQTLLLLLLQLHFSAGCPHRKTSPINLNKVLNEAKESNGSGTMHLRGYGSPKFLVAEWPPQTEIIRVPEGGKLFIPCSNPNNLQVSHIANPPAFAYNGVQYTIKGAALTWEPLNETYRCCNCTNNEIVRSLTVSGYQVATGAFTIELDHFSYVYTGLYDCLHSNGSQLVVTKRYWVSATLIRHKVFDPPMKNVTVRYGDPAEMVCAVRFSFLPGSFENRFLWRKGVYLLWAGSIAKVAVTARSPYRFNGYFTFGENGKCLCNSTLKLNSATWEGAGLYECWFRINDRLDEWVVQEAYLHVI
ncbi:uncharacterized protein LOC129593980 [Paramacrobiotus metropolitanus]|uniref:uncharacterized protein LOC129593980 n=1 Tax=Paramacrobiotus metropolitanus TaxID=2943436 RepID=UPI0024462F09|nr:uncharacterized protein LOC129593980 [Paramacrobiotus metropolitanus]